MQNKFFGSKLNTMLLFILIILMAGALYLMLRDKKTYFAPFVREKVQQIPIQQKTIEEKESSNNQSINQSVKYDVSFFKPKLILLPDSVIEQCTLSGSTYFRFLGDKIILSTATTADGREVSFYEHVVGSIPELYSSTGTKVAVCSYNQEPSTLCGEVKQDSCKPIYVSKLYASDSSLKAIDIFNLKP